MSLSQDRAAVQPGLSMPRRLWLALPRLDVALGGAVVWSAIMAASAFVMLTLRTWEISRQIEVITVIFAIGALVAFPVALMVARFMGRGKPVTARFAAAFVSFSVFTVGLTALVYALDYRQYYSEWHDHSLSFRFLMEFLTTIAAAVYQFAVLGLTLFFPIGFVALLAASLWFARLKD